MSGGSVRGLSVRGLSVRGGVVRGIVLEGKCLDSSEVRILNLPSKNSNPMHCIRN